ncbi:hypothetical protein RHGRI_001139 [Rhododendron griersonianum]|uniref:Uncharacterized protein n=1 Tax=Rhododendron griersonianum TaxID=479676 RepID=A0AAV6LK01_9ERIC|nr:hypothetical protein RHGRI_001139 [Rhododendron griersonianum]
MGAGGREVPISLDGVRDKNLMQLKKLNTALFPVRYNYKYYADALAFAESSLFLAWHLDLNSNVYSNDAWYNVIDDISPIKLKHWKELIGAQTGWQTDMKCLRPVLVTASIPCIVLCNPGPNSAYKAFLDKPENEALRIWTEGNAIFVVLQQALFTSTDQGGAQESQEGQRVEETSRVPLRENTNE